MRVERRDTLIIWKIDRLGRNLRDLIEIVTSLEARGVGVKSLTNGIVDTTTAHGKLVFGIFALMAEYEAALIQERTMAGLAAARARTGGRKPKMTPELTGKAQRTYDAKTFTMAEIAASCGVTPMTIPEHQHPAPLVTASARLSKIDRILSSPTMAMTFCTLSVQPTSRSPAADQRRPRRRLQMAPISTRSGPSGRRAMDARLGERWPCG
jgi:hypothetical protein